MQRKALETIVTDGKNAFVTGAAGTGKSFLLRRIIESLEALKRKVAPTAVTGNAALQLSGARTVNSFFEVGIAKESVHELVQRAKKNRRVLERLRETEVLIIDEISMCTIHLFEAMDAILKYARRSEFPFGGLQLVLCGDFGQLPPVVTESEKRSKDFVMTTKLWKEAELEHIELTEVMRQKDAEFVALLQRVRVAEHTKEDVELLKSRVGKEVVTPEGIRPVNVFSHNTDVDRLNMIELGKIDGPPKVFKYLDVRVKAADAGKDANTKLEKMAEALARSVNVSTEIALKEGAQIILCANMNVRMGLVNGSVGRIVRFAKRDEKEFESHSLALFRTKEVRMRFPDVPELPVVEFETADRRKVRFILGYTYWSMEDEAVGSVMFWQLPVRLGYAITVHRSQGQTIPYLVADPSKIFQHGMFYVLLSRARSLEGVSFLSFDPKVIHADDSFLRFQRRGLVEEVDDDAPVGEEEEEAWW